MLDQHPITPPDKQLVRKWIEDWAGGQIKGPVTEAFWVVATEAARWGADQELGACCEWLKKNTDCHITIEFLRDARRPKPTTLAEQATAELDEAVMRGDCITTTDAMPLLRAALNRLAELEALPQ
jgi:hypothetical protein